MMFHCLIEAWHENSKHWGLIGREREKYGQHACARRILNPVATDKLPLNYTEMNLLPPNQNKCHSVLRNQLFDSSCLFWAWISRIKAIFTAMHIPIVLWCNTLKSPIILIFNIPEQSRRASSASIIKCLHIKTWNGNITQSLIPPSHTPNIIV